MGQWSVGVLAHLNRLFGLALVPVENDAGVVCGYPRSLRSWFVVLRLLSPMVGSQEHSLEGGYISEFGTRMVCTCPPSSSNLN